MLGHRGQRDSLITSLDSYDVGFAARSFPLSSLVWIATLIGKRFVLSPISLSLA